MAPLSFSDKIGLYALIGTWLGTLCTFVGLLAIVAQVRSLVKDFAQAPKERVRVAAGDWAICFPTLGRSDTGVLEGRAPSLSAWLYHHYNAEGNRRDIIVSPYERFPTGGQSSWSRLFARLQIQPQTLLDLGGPFVKPIGTRTMPWKASPVQTDLLINGEKISYGMSGFEFTALLILSGFSPSRFDLDKTSNATGHVGHMYLGARDGDPFSQIAQMDYSRRELGKQYFHGEGRFAHCLNVRHCIDLAHGILRYKSSKDQSRMLILNTTQQQSYHPSADREDLIMMCFAQPDPQRLVTLRRNIKRYASEDVENEIVSAERHNFYDLFDCQLVWKHYLPTFDLLEKKNIELTMRTAVALKALQPWGLPPVLPRRLADALCPLLKKSLIEEQLTTPIMLIRKFQELPNTTTIDIPNWEWSSLETALPTLNHVTSQSFSGKSSQCALYYDTMKFLFRYHNINMESVETGVAARCAAYYAHMRQMIVTVDAGAGEELQGSVRAAIREQLNGSPIAEVEMWALEVFALYLYAWLNDSIPIEDDFRKNFRRRVFLG